jgi:hypothetical protein
MAMTVDGGTNHYWGWGANYEGEVGNGTNGPNSGGTYFVYSPAGPLQFCTRCQRCVQLGTGGPSAVFTAQCNGTLYLYFNGDTNQIDSYSGSYTAIVNGVTTNVSATTDCGVPVAYVTNGQVCSFSASGTCYWSAGDLTTASDPNGNGPGGPWDCSDFTIINKTNAVCPMWQCYSLVGRIQ